MATICSVVIDLSAEDRARLDLIVELLKRRPNCERCSDGIVKYVAAELAGANLAETAPTATAPAETAPEVHPIETPFQELPAGTPAPFEGPIYKLSDIQQKVVALSAAGKKKDKVREIVKRFADKVSAIPEDKYAEVMAALVELEGRP